MTANPTVKVSDIISVILLKGFSRFRIDEEDKINEILNLC